MSSTYTAATIGPIYKTLNIARKTRELWGASYLISYIMRRLIEEIGKPEKLCLPYHEKLLDIWKGKGVGLFPDRLFFEGDIIDQIKDAESVILNEIHISSNLPLDYLKNYFHIHTLNYTLPQEISNSEDNVKRNNENNNIIFVGNTLLDTIELKEKHYLHDINNIEWKKGIDKINGNRFYKESFTKWNDKQFEFPSIVEIATDDFRKENKVEYYKLVDIHLKHQEENDQNNFLNALKNATKFDITTPPNEAAKEDGKSQKKKVFGPISFRPYHKYIAVVQADGDNIGTTIAKIGDDPSTIRFFSSALFDFAIAAHEKIKNYGGKAVYIGGDDLLFFAPVAIHSEGENGPMLKSIFGLLGEIDSVFEQTIIKNPNLNSLYHTDEELKNPDEFTDKIIKPSMSYGVSITYSKYPLNEARDTAYHLMLKAKEKKWDKNKICFKLHKHSGQGFGFTIDKKLNKAQQQPESFKYFMKMVNNIPLQEGFLSSVIYKLAPLHQLLIAIAAEKQRVIDFFDQEFELEKLKVKRTNSGLSDRNERSKLNFLENVVEYFYHLAIEFPNDNKDIPAMETEQPDSNIAKLYSTLRFMKHLTDETDD